MKFSSTMTLNRDQAILKEFYIKQDSQIYPYLNADIRICEYMNYYIGFPEPSKPKNLMEYEQQILLKYPLHFENIIYSDFYVHYGECYICSMDCESHSLISNSLTTLLGVFKRLDTNYLGGFESFLEFYQYALNNRINHPSLYSI